MKKDLKSRLRKVESQREKAVKELAELEKLVSEDGVEVEALDQDELIELIEKKAISTDRTVSETALHVLAAGECAGSYGCGGAVEDK